MCVLCVTYASVASLKSIRLETGSQCSDFTEIISAVVEHDRTSSVKVRLVQDTSYQLLAFGIANIFFSIPGGAIKNVPNFASL